MPLLTSWAPRLFSISSVSERPKGRPWAGDAGNHTASKNQEEPVLLAPDQGAVQPLEEQIRAP